MTPADIRLIIVEEIGEIAPEADVSRLGDREDLREAIDLDSMDIFNLVVALSRRLGIAIPDADAGKLVTLGGGVEYLAEQLGASGAG